MDILASLNAAQRQAVESIAGPLLILAGPGSGKTRVITHRIAYLVLVCGLNPHNIMAVTFTNKAAQEMLNRLTQLVPHSIENLTLGTFHAICARILRREGQSIGLDLHFVIYDDDDQIALIKQVLREMNLDEKKYQLRALQSYISAAKSELRNYWEYAEQARTYWEEIVARVYKRYQELLLQNKGLDFDDLLMTTVRLFRESPDVLERYQRRYVHILVDEFQDTNIAQYVLVKLLAAKHRNICVVGDEDQSIYGWRQADIRNILNFESDFPDARVIRLEQNYRSTKTILTAARQVITVNRMRKEKNLWTSNEEGQPVTIFEAYDEQEEAGYVAREIERLVTRDSLQPRDCAVMYRTNAQSRVLEETFLRYRLPYKLVGATRFYERKEVKDILAYLRVIYNSYDTVSLNRIINVPGRGLGQKTLLELDRWSRQVGLPSLAALRLLRGEQEGTEASGRPRFNRPESPFGTRTEHVLLNLLHLFEELIAASQQLNLVELMDLLLAKSGYAEMIRDGTEEGEERWENIRELASVAAAYRDLQPRVGLARFLEEVALVSEVDNYDEKASAVTLITLHAAKGLEFPVVFIVGMEEGICPHSRSFDDPAAMEEERRLCYVGMTRAMQRLYLVYAFRRTLYGAPMRNAPSRFLADIPSHLLKEAAPANKGLGYESEEALRVVAPETRNEGAPRFKSGDRVKHAKFGEGVVVSSTIVGGDEEVTVAFHDVGVKRLSLNFAPLQLI
ncbi:MAG: UvrD-helicase domain-containing protein [Chloroflexi bacterium]|nr:UvrD-helicase domain-containing protein [Chloroflexota bacterium]MCL5074940.1 UvrD-helicase domain-containing protein [Chloroflexota bacterium]